MEVYDQQPPKLVITKAIRAVFALGFRQVVIQVVNLLGGILLARLLSPKEFGIYAIVTFTMNFMVSFAGSGIAANLIRQDEEPTIKDYQAVFSFQQAVVTCLCLILWLAAPLISACYNLPSDDKWIFRLIAIAFFATSFMVIPEVMMERKLCFDKLAVLEVSQTIVFWGSTLLLVWRGWGTLSFAIALVFRSIAGIFIAYQVSPWNLGWKWDWKVARKHLSYGILFQGALFVSLIKDSITPIFIGLLLGMRDVGYINWAQMVAAYPVLVLMAFQRVYLPAFARMQSHKEQLSVFVEHTIMITNAITAPLAIITMILIVPLTEIMFGAKWLGALNIFYFLWVANIFVPTATPLLGLLNAIGCSQVTFRFALIWMFGTWLLGVPLIWFLGSIGFAVANALIQLTNLILYRTANKYLTFRIKIIKIWCISLCLAPLLFLFQRLAPVTSWLQLVTFVIGYIGLYTSILMYLYRYKIRDMLVLIRS